jgi:predicted ester cyclase
MLGATAIALMGLLLAVAGCGGDGGSSGAGTSGTEDVTLPNDEAARGASEAKRNKAVVRRFVEEVQNKKDPDAYDELNDPEFVNLSAPPGVPADREGGKGYLWALFDAFPESHWTIDDMIAEGDRVVTKKTMTGTHTGDFAGIPATGKSVRLQYVDILRVRDGRFIEHWLSMDQLSFMQQLGVIPEPTG